MSFQTCMILFVLWNIKDILKNIGKQMVLGPIDFHSMDKNAMEDKRDPELFGHPHSWRYLLCSTEEEFWNDMSVSKSLQFSFLGDLFL